MSTQHDDGIVVERSRKEQETSRSVLGQIKQSESELMSIGGLLALLR